MGVFLRAYDRNGAALGLMPDFTDLNVQTVDNEPGTMTFRYLKDGVFASLLDRDELFLSVNEDGVVSSDLFVLEDDTDDPVQTLMQTKRRWITVSARGYMLVLEQAVVYPKGANASGSNLYGLKPEFKFDDATPGNIMAVLINAAKARGALNELQYDFITATDSAGRAWPKKYDITIPAGANLLSVLTDMINDGWVDARVEGRKLRLFVPDTYFGTKSDMLRYGQNVTSAPRKRSRRNILSHVLAAGDADKKATVQVANTGTAARFGRREGFAQDGRLTKTAALTSLGNRELSTHQQFKEAFTLEMVMNPPGPGEAWPRPGIDFFVGDRIYYDRARISSTEYQPLLVRSITKAWGDTTKAATCSIELADLFVKQTARTAAQVSAITNGSTGVRMPAPRAPQRDSFPPVGPSTVTVTGASRLIQEGVRKVWRSKATITWPFVDQDSDGTELEDLDAYEVQVSVNGSAWAASRVSKDLVEVIDWLNTGDTVRARVLARDWSGNRSDWTYSTTVTMPVDKTPPAKPTSCTVTGVSVLVDEVIRKTYRAAATVTWPAVTLDSDGSALDDLDCYEVSTSVNGGPWSPVRDSNDLTEPLDGLNPLDTVQARVQARDWAGNRSGWTTSAVVTMPLDTTPPPQPTVPILTQRHGVVTVRWDGLYVGGAAQPADFHHVIVERCSASTFLTGVVDVDDLYQGDATALVTGLPYEEEWYFRLIAVDVAGNRSLPSAVASIATEPLVNGDLPAQVISDIDAAIEAANAAGTAAAAAQGTANAAATQTSFDAAVTSINTSIGTVDTKASQAKATAEAAATQSAFDALSSNLSSNYYTKTGTEAYVQTTANGRTKIYTATTDAPATGTFVAGDIWRKYDTLGNGGKLLAEWTYTLPGGMWVTRVYSGLILTELNAASITAGFLDAARINAGSLTIGQVGGLGTSLSDAQGAATSAVTERINLAAKPAGTSASGLQNIAGWGANWFGPAPASGTTTAITNASDGPIAGLKTYVRKTWTVATTSNGDTGFGNTQDTTNSLPVDPNVSYAFSSYMRSSAPGKRMRMRVKWFTSAGAAIGAEVFSYPTSAETPAAAAGVWTRISVVATSPATAAYARVWSDVTDVAADVKWAVGDTLDGTALLIERATGVGSYFDGNTTATADRTFSWTGAADASTSRATATVVVAAQNAATQAALVADTADAINTNPSFTAWSGAYPDGWKFWSGAAPTKETAIVRTPPNAVRINCPDTTTSRGITTTSTDAGSTLSPLPFGLDYVLVTVDVYLASGASLSGAGVLFDWTGIDASAGKYRTYISFGTEVPNPVTGKWYRISKVVKKPAGTNPQTAYAAFLMANYAIMAGTALTVKDVIFNRFSVRPATVEEAAAFNAAPAATVTALDAAINSKGTDLVTNGTGLLGNNTNFTASFDFSATDAPVGATGSFVHKNGAAQSALIDELIPYDPGKTYRFSFQMRQTLAGAVSRAYGFVAPYDATGLSVQPYHYMWITGTTTTLAQALNPGDTTIKLTSAANWYGQTGKAAAGSTHWRSIIWWDYVDTLGKAWPAETYSRNWSNSDYWADGGVDLATNTITLKAPYAGVARPAGTKLSNGSSGGSYLYMPSLQNGVIPETWTAYADTFPGGVLASGGGPVGAAATWATGMPPGTAKLKVGWLLNYAPTSGKHAVAAVSFSDASAANFTANAVTTLTNGWKATGKTTINGGAIEADTILAAAIKADQIGARQLAVGDMSNMAELTEAIAGNVTYSGVSNTIETVSGVPWSNRTSIASGYFMFRNQTGPLPFKQGDRIRLTFEAFSDIAVAATPYLWTYGTTNVNAAFTAAPTPAGGVAWPTTITTTAQQFAFELTVPALTDQTAFLVGLALTANRNVRVKNARAYRMGAGELVVDGSIEGRALKVGTVDADRIIASTLTIGKVTGLDTALSGKEAAGAAAAAQAAAIAAAATDATSKANAAQTAATTAATTAAASDAQARADAAKAAALTAAAADAKAKADAAEGAAKTAAAADADAKASAAQAAAITAAASDAKAKADAAELAAKTAAAADATSKANTAKADAITAAAAAAATTYGPNNALVDGWKINGKTTIQGGAIEADTITAAAIKANQIGVKHLAVGDMSNMAELNETIAGNVAYSGSKNIIETVAGAPWSKRDITTNPYFMFRNQTGPLPLKQGDRVRLTFEAFADANVTADPRLWTYTNGVNGPAGITFTVAPTPAGGSPWPTTITTTPQSFAFEGTIGATTDQNQFLIGLNGITSRDVRVRNVRAYRMGAGELIVDGSIEAKHIKANSITATQIDASTLTIGQSQVTNLATTLAGKETAGAAAAAQAAAIAAAATDATGKANTAKTDAITAAADAATAAYGPTKTLVTGWSLSGKTTINGGAIEADTLSVAAIKAGSIGVSKLAVADTANMVDVNETNPGTVTQTTGTTLVSSGYSARTDETVATFRLGQKKGPIPFKLGERLRFTTRAYVTSGAVTATVRLWVFKSDDTVSASQDLGTIALTTAPTNFAVEANITLDVTDRATYYLELAGVANQTVRVQSTRCYRMGAGELLVDGSIQAKHMSANSIKADSIEAGAIDVDKLQLGVLRSNLVADPGFEATSDLSYFTDPGQGVTYQWRQERSGTAPTVYRGAGKARTGARRLVLAIEAGGTTASVARAYSATFRLDPDPLVAKSFRVNWYCLANGTGATGANTPKLTVDALTGASASTLNTAAPVAVSDGVVNPPYVAFPSITADSYTQFSGDIVIPAGTTPTYWALRFTSTNNAPDTYIYLDDVSVVESAVGGASELTSAGLRLFDDEGDETTALVSNRPNYFTVSKGTDVVAGVSSDGFGSFTGLSIMNPVDSANWIDDTKGFILPGGEEHTERMWRMPQGIIAQVYRGGSAYNVTKIRTEYGLYEISFVQVPGRFYRVTASGGQVSTNSTTGNVSAIMRARYTVSSDGQNAPAPTIGSTLARGSRTLLASTQAGYTVSLPPLIVQGNFIGGSTVPQVVRVMFTLNASNAGGTEYLDWGNGAGGSFPTPIECIVEDLGPDVPDTFQVQTGGGVLFTGGTDTGGGTAPPVQKKTYVTYWTATDSQTRRGTNNYGAANTINPTSITGTGKVLAGYYSSSNGNQHAYAEFAGAATGGSEAGKLLTGGSSPAITSGTTITKVEVYVKCVKTYASSGGAQRFGMTNLANISTATSLTPGAASTYTGLTSFTEGQGKWVTLPSGAWDVIKGGGRVVIIGPGDSGNKNHYTSWASHVASGKPLLRVTYIK